MKQNRLHIVHVIYHLDFGGLEQIVLQTVIGLPEFKHSIISLTSKSEFSENFPNDIDIYCLHKKPGNSITIYKHMYDLFVKLKPDVCHTYNLAGIELQPIAMLAGISLRVHSEHGTSEVQAVSLNKKHAFVRFISSFFCKKIITVNQNLADWLVGRIGVKQNKLVVIENGINLKSFMETRNDRSINNQCIRFGTVARLAPEKDQETLLRSFALLIKNISYSGVSVSLDVWGDGPLASYLLDVAKELKITDQVTFYGSTNTVAQALSQLDVFMLTSVSEGMPMTILEAMASGVPVITTRVGNLPPLISKSNAGQLVDVADIKSISAAMEKYILEPELRLEHGMNALKYAKAKFDQEIMLSAYRKIYQGDNK